MGSLGDPSSGPGKRTLLEDTAVERVRATQEAPAPEDHAAAGEEEAAATQVPADPRAPGSPQQPVTPGPPAPPADPARPAWRRGRRWHAAAWIAGSLAVLMAVVSAGGYLLLRHFNANIQQDNISGLLGAQPVNTHPQAENILVIGSDSRQGLSGAYGHNLTTDQSDTIMIVHIPADRQWAEVMSIPRDSWVNIPSCKMGNGQMSSPTQFKINEAFALGNLYGNHTELGVACTVKAIEQDTGIYVNHFVAINFTGFQDMVAALGGVEECNTTPINDPKSGLHLSAGHHLLTPPQALAYVRARYSLGDGSDLERITRQQAFMSSLISRVKGKLLDPLAIYRFLDAATRSLIIDSQLGGVTGLYNLGESLRSIPRDKIAFFTVPNYPRSEVTASDTANVLWTQPEDNQIFASFRNDVPASSTLFAAPAKSPSGSPAPAQDKAAKPAASAASPAASAASPAASGSPAATAGPSHGASPSSPAYSLQARTASQTICAA